MYQTKESRGWIGIIGAIIVIIGIFLPVISISAWGVTLSFSYLDLITMGSDLGADMGSAVAMCIAAIALAVIGAVLYLMRNNKIGGGLSVAGLIVFLASVFAGMDLGSIGDVIGFLGMGFWLMLIGYIVMVLSNVLKGVNASIEGAFGGNKG